jgi:hypothetical protein
MRAYFADRLAHTLDSASRQAAAAGLTPAVLDELLADES